MQGLKKDTHCHWFGQTARLDGIFNHLEKWYYRTDPDSGKKVYFQEKTLNLVNHGRCKVFAIRRGEDKRIRYYATNVLKISIDRLLKRLKTHWRVETMHRDLKELCCLNGCNSGRQNLNHVHWLLCYLAYYLFCQYQHRLSCKGVEVTIPYLFNHYYYSYDESRAYRCFSSPLSRSKLQRRLVTF